MGLTSSPSTYGLPLDTATLFSHGAICSVSESSNLLSKLRMKCLPNVFRIPSIILSWCFFSLSSIFFPLPFPPPSLLSSLYPSYHLCFITFLYPFLLALVINMQTQLWVFPEKSLSLSPKPVCQSLLLFYPHQKCLFSFLVNLETRIESSGLGSRLHCPFPK